MVKHWTDVYQGRPEGAYGWLSDEECANKVRMLMRNALDHEAVCTMARDRIAKLSREVRDARAPEGWALVPKEPTEAMCIAGVSVWDTTPADAGQLDDAKNTYRAMLAAAPSSPSARDVVPTMEMPLSDVNDLDAVVRELGIGESDTTPAEAVRELNAEIDRLHAALAARPAPDAAPAQEGMKCEWETFQDRAYYDFWAVRRVGDRDFNSPMLFHVTSEAEADNLICALTGDGARRASPAERGGE